MIIFALYACLVVAFTTLVYVKLKPKHTEPDRTRAFDRGVWLVTSVAALASALFAWPVSTDTMSDLWLPATAVFNASSTWAIVMLGSTIVRYVFFHGKRA